MDYLTATLALGTLAGGLHHAEGCALGGLDRARALTIGADLGGRALGTARALTIGALLDLGNKDLFLYAEGRLLELDVYGGTQIIALARCVGVSATAAKAAEATEDIAEDIAKTTEALEAAETATAKALIGVKCGMAELVVLCTLIGIAQHLICLVYLLKASLALLVAGMQVRVIFLGKLSVCFFKLILRRALTDAEDLIIISFFCHKSTSNVGVPEYAHILICDNYLLSSSTTV